MCPGENHYMAGKSAWAQAPAGRNSRVMERGTLQRQELVWICQSSGISGVSAVNAFKGAAALHGSPEVRMPPPEGFCCFA